MSQIERDLEEELLTLANALDSKGTQLKHTAQTLKTLREAHFYKDRIADAMKAAVELLKQYDGWWVSFETLRENYKIKRADMNQLREYQRRQSERLDVMKPRYNLSETRLLSLIRV